MKKIFYWSPLISNIATRKAVINSAISLVKYSKDYKISLLNVVGEFNDVKKGILNLEVIDWSKNNFFQKLPSKGFLKSRISFIYIFFSKFFLLMNIIKKQNPDFLIVHLITSLPMFLFLIFNFNTRCILRISGYPQMNFIRYLFWKICSKKIYKITCPTINTLNYLKNLNIFDHDKLVLLSDPIIQISSIVKNNKSNNLSKEKYIFAAGRLTKQKNFDFLIKAFNQVSKINNNLKLYIAGEGEEENRLKKLVQKLGLRDKVLFLGFKDNIIDYMRNCELFVLSSLWEDPGFVLIEAAYARANILSSDCQSGPIEFLENGKCGFVFKSNNLDDFLTQYKKTLDTTDNVKKIKKVNALKSLKKFTIFNHFKELNKILK